MVLEEEILLNLNFNNSSYTVTIAIIQLQVGKYVIIYFKIQNNQS